MNKDDLRIGVLAIQGGFAAHQRSFDQLGIRTVQVRTVKDFAGLHGLVLPGGESTTMMMGLERERLVQPIRDAVNSGLSVMATCAGMILVSREYLGLADFSVLRNAYGPQVHSFEVDLQVCFLDNQPFRGVFIRAPLVKEVGERVEVLATVHGKAVALCHANTLAFAFHPELTEDLRLHHFWVKNLYDSVLQ